MESEALRSATSGKTVREGEAVLRGTTAVEETLENGCREGGS